MDRQGSGTGCSDRLGQPLSFYTCIVDIDIIYCRRRIQYISRLEFYPIKLDYSVGIFKMMFSLHGVLSRRWFSSTIPGAVNQENSTFHF